MSVECSAVVWKRNFSGASRKVVAVKLADHADDEGRGIWPSVERIAAQCDISCRTVQRVLADFVREGILKIVSEGGNGPGDTRRYDFDMAKVRSLPLAVAPLDRKGDTPKEAENKGDNLSPFENRKGDTDDAKGDTDDRKGCHGVTQTVIEPPIEPSERENARARVETNVDRATVPGTAEFTKRLQRFLSGDGYRKGEWPNWAKATTIEYISKHFARLNEDHRKAAEHWRDAFLDKAGKQVMGAGNYFRDHAWEVLLASDPGKSATVQPGKPEGWAASYSPEHAVRYFRILLSGPGHPEAAPSNGLWLFSHLRTAWPQLAAFWQISDIKGGFVVAPADHALADHMVFVPVDTELMEAWKLFFREKGLPEPRIMASGAYFPAGGPDHLDRFAKAVCDHDDAQEQDA